MKNLKENKKGFTIIEVMIVLVIAAAIILIVLLVVPSVQRNSRNTKRNSDIGRIGAATQEIMASADQDITQVTDTNVRTAVGKPAQYVDTNISVTDGVATPTNATTTETVIVYRNAKCTGTNAELQSGSKKIAITYTLETSNKQCKEL